MGANRNHRSAFARSLSQIHVGDLPQNQPPTPPTPQQAIADSAEVADARSPPKRQCRPSVRHGASARATSRFAGAADDLELPFANDRDISTQKERRQRRRATTQEAIRPSTVPELSGDEEPKARGAERIQRLQIDDDGDCDRPTNGSRESSEPSRPQHHAPSNPNAAGPADDVHGGHLGFRPDYKLGDTLRTPDDVIVQPSREAQLIAVRSLSQHDFAFVQRSDGSFSYGILAFSKPASEGESREEALVFVLCEEGSTKSVKRKYWNDRIRLVNTIRGHGEVAVNASRPDTAVGVSRSHSPTCVRDRVDHDAYYRRDEQQRQCDHQGRPTHPNGLKVGPLSFSRGDLDALPGAGERDLSCPPSEIRFVNGQQEEEYSVMSSVSHGSYM